MDDAVLIIGGGILPTYMAQEAQAMGLKALVVDGNPHAPGTAIADASYPVDAYDAEACAALIPHIQQTYTLCGVCTAGADVAPTVARCAEQAGTSGIPYEVVRRTHHKGEVRQTLEESGLGYYQPDWWCVNPNICSSLALSYSIQRNIGFPCVVKPVSQRASRGITIVSSSANKACFIAIEKAMQYGSNDVLIEACLVGTEHSAEIIFGTDGTPCFWNIVDRFFDYSSGTGIELGHVNPTCLPAQTQQQILLMVLAAAQALEVNFGPFKIDVMLTAEGPRVLECTCRLSGGLDSQRTSPLTGRHPMRQVLQLTCGLPVDSQSVAEGYAACAAILPQKHGRVGELPMIRTEDHEVIWCIRRGEDLAPITHNGLRPGFVLVHDTYYFTAWSRAKTMADTLASLMIFGPGEEV